MTAAQNAKYFAEFGRLRDVLRARGWSPTRIEQHRHEITRKALGVDKSSKEFTNAELDRVLAEISAQLAPADFGAQMRVQDMPDKRVSLLVGRIEALAGHMDLPTHYVDGISRRMFGRQYHELPERGLQQIEGILRRRLRQSARTVEQIAEIERQVAEEAAGRLTTLAGAFARPNAAAAAAITSEPDFDPAAPFG